MSVNSVSISVIFEQEFHCILTGTPPGRNVSYDKLMPAVANYVRNLPNASARSTFQTISRDIFNKIDKMDMIKNSCDSYQLFPLPCKYNCILHRENFTTRLIYKGPLTV